MTKTEAAWDAEIDARVKEIKTGKVRLVSAEVAIRRVRAKLAAHRQSAGNLELLSRAEFSTEFSNARRTLARRNKQGGPRQLALDRSARKR